MFRLVELWEAVNYQFPAVELKAELNVRSFATQNTYWGIFLV